MKKQTINKVLDKKINHWLSSIEDKNVMVVAKENIIVTGGAIASMILNEPVNDYDIYFKTRYAAKKVAKYYLERFDRTKNNFSFSDDIGPENRSFCDDPSRLRIIIPSSGIAGENEHEASELSSALKTSGNGDLLKPTLSDDIYQTQFVTENAITLSNKVQLITRFIGQPDEIHNNYDFIHATAYYDVGEGKLVVPPAVYECLINKELRYVGSLYPFASIVRVRKFVQRGWTINAGQILKMAMQLNDFDLKDPAILREQLTGVDLSFFEEVLSAIPDGKFTTAYICKLIDKIFG